MEGEAAFFLLLVPRFLISPPLSSFHFFLSFSLFYSFQVLSGLTEDEMMVFDGKCDRVGVTTRGLAPGKIE